MKSTAGSLTLTIVAPSLKPQKPVPVATSRSGSISKGEAPVLLSLPPDVELPILESPLGVRLVGTIELELDIDENGAPEDVKIVRSSIPEVNPRLLGEASTWRFPNAAGTTGRLVLDLTAEP